MGLNQADPRPPYQQIADVLRGDIISGRYATGDTLPSGPVLVERFGVAMGTVRSAIRVLRDEELVTPWQGKGVVVRGPLSPVPQGFPAARLEGAWLTAYQFTHNGEPHHHADVACVTALSGAGLRARNYPPEPRTEGRATPFRNEIEARLAGRHLIGHWRNTSDTRYFGSLHLAVQPGETVMEGYYTGVASDIAVSMGPWKWVRIARADDVAGIALRNPRALWELAASREQDDMPLALNEIREED
jgi:Bacterial regulatory proteins, gntR family